MFPPRLAKRALMAQLVLLSIVTPNALAQRLPRSTPEDVGMSSSKLQEALDAIESLHTEKRLAGAVTLISRRGQVVTEHVVGERDLEDGDVMTADTLFRIYSMTKPITSVAIMILVENEIFGLDDPVSSLLDEFEGLQRYVSGSLDSMVLAPPNREMTVRDLLRHTSGLSYGFRPNSVVDQSYRKEGIGGREIDLTTFIEKLGRCPLQFEPGTQYGYSYSTDVLGGIVEVASGQPLDEFFAEHIFEPLGMVDTAFHAPEEKHSRFASNYGPNPQGGLRLVDDREGSRFAREAVFLSGGGGLVSTAEDYMRFCQMLLNGGTLGDTRILTEETVAQMTSNHLPETVMSKGGVFGDKTLGFGLGFSVRLESHANAAAGEYGWGGAASTSFWISPKDELIVVTLSQIMPMSQQLEQALKARVYAAILDRGPSSQGG